MKKEENVNHLDRDELAIKVLLKLMSSGEELVPYFYENDEMQENKDRINLLTDTAYRIADSMRKSRLKSFS